MACATALTIAFVLPAGDADAFSEPIPMKISLLKWGGTPPVGKLYKIVSKPSPESQPSGLFSLPDAGTSDPVTNGGTLEVEVGLGGPRGTLNCTLLGGAFDGTQGWKGLGNPAGSKGYKYTNKLAPTNDPCKIAIIKEKVIKVLAKSVGDIDPPGGPNENPDVYAFLTAGTDDYCALALATHFKEKENSLIKIKDQDAPATCQRCGDDAVNLPGEECDGTEDSACPGNCIPRGGGGGVCGDNLRNTGEDCTCASEECDGTDSPACPGLCLANCTCPIAICNNAVKEVGEECDPPGSTANCPVGEICGGFCTCVPDIACDCGSPDPTMYKFTTKPPVEANCGTTDGGPPIDNLACMALYIGGGGGGLPVPTGVEDEGTFKFNIAQCKGSDLTLAYTTPAEVGSVHCTEGKKCSAGSDNAGDLCLRDYECPGGTCEAGCFYLAPLPILDIELPTLSTCILNEVAESALGGVNCETGKTFFRVALDTRVHMTLLDQSPTIPGYQACPMCLGGSLWVPSSGTCSGGPKKNLPCTPQSTPYDAHNCCTGGGNYSKPCSEDSDCPASTCEPGCSGYPTSYDCPPHPLTDVSGIFWVGFMEPGDISKTADDDGNFCGWCRDIDAEGSGCFEGDPDPDGNDADHLGDKGCPDSSIIACRPVSYGTDYPAGDPADLAQCGDSLPCRTDADCTAPYETCEQRNPGAWRDATVRNITVRGKLPDDPDLRDKQPHRGAVGTNFCIPPTFVPSIDNQADLGGPGAFSLEGNHQLSTSGAFLDVTPGLLE